MSGSRSGREPYRVVVQPTEKTKEERERATMRVAHVLLKNALKKKKAS